MRRFYQIFGVRRLAARLRCPYPLLEARGEVPVDAALTLEGEAKTFVQAAEARNVGATIQAEKFGASGSGALETRIDESTRHRTARMSAPHRKAMQ